jgi:hypothetical protein
MSPGRLFSQKVCSRLFPPRRLETALAAQTTARGRLGKRSQSCSFPDRLRPLFVVAFVLRRLRFRYPCGENLRSNRYGRQRRYSFCYGDLSPLGSRWDDFSGLSCNDWEGASALNAILRGIAISLVNFGPAPNQQANLGDRAERCFIFKDNLLPIHHIFTLGMDHH